MLGRAMRAFQVTPWPWVQAIRLRRSGYDYWLIGKMLVRHNWPIMRCVVEEDFAGGGGRSWYG